jgi:hypothetical protein
MRTSFHHQPEAQHPNFQLSTSCKTDTPSFGGTLTRLFNAPDSGGISVAPIGRSAAAQAVPSWRPFEGQACIRWWLFRH